MLDDFERRYPYAFDDFQRRAIQALADGRSVLVAAPTGSGKTVVGEFSARLAMDRRRRCFYTSPIKALTNQKYGDFVGQYGPEDVGLLTGDNSINGSGRVICMTTEVLRNMIYEESPDLEALEYVVLDEVHYLQDPYRGAVWEEILIHLPVDVKIVSLSATVSNAEEVAEWIQTLRGPTEVIIEERRPVEIKQWYFVSDELLPMFVDSPSGESVPNPRAREFDRRSRRGAGPRPQRGDHRSREKRARIPLRTEVVDRLNAEGMLPGIYFIFSRKGCDLAVRQCLQDNVNLTNPEERRAIREYADLRVADLDETELEVLGYSAWVEGLARGVAAHHAGMIPPFKETVEDLFARGLVKVVFATETLALGINMPARSVVIESLMKFTGERHEQMTPGEYTQLSGRAGRRGIDAVGHCVVLHQRYTPFDALTRLATTRTYPLQSSFRPSYNMTVNLVRNYERDEAEHLVNSSFAQFQADRDVVRVERARERSAAYLASYRERMSCDLGDFAEYWELNQNLRKRSEGTERTREGRKRTTDAIGRLRPGDVIEILGGRRRGRYAVIRIADSRSERGLRLLALSESRSIVRLGPNDLRDPPRRIGRVEIGPAFHSRDPAERRRLARRLTEMEVGSDGFPERRGVTKEVRAIERAVANHPCHSCPELSRHLHYAERAARLQREVDAMDRRIKRRTGTLARQFERVLAVLERLGYVDDWRLTDKGDVLTRVYNEADLLVVEALEQQVLADLSPAELAAVLSTLVYQARGPDVPVSADMPTAATQRSYRRLMRLWNRIKREEAENGVDLTREPDPGFAQRAYQWTSGRPLEDVLDLDDPPGDFVRSTKQLIDLCRQLEPLAADPAIAGKIGAAIDGLQRGVVAYSSLEL